MAGTCRPTGPRPPPPVPSMRPWPQDWRHSPSPCTRQLVDPSTPGLALPGEPSAGAGQPKGYGHHSQRSSQAATHTQCCGVVTLLSGILPHPSCSPLLRAPPACPSTCHKYTLLPLYPPALHLAAPPPGLCAPCASCTHPGPHPCRHPNIPCPPSAVSCCAARGMSTPTRALHLTLATSCCQAGTWRTSAPRTSS